jgi:hypothetical protein
MILSSSAAFAGSRSQLPLARPSRKAIEASGEAAHAAVAKLAVESLR